MAIRGFLALALSLLVARTAATGGTLEGVIGAAAEPRLVDCNTNGIPDELELSRNDCNSNGVPDECDLFGNDCNQNGRPDDCELGSPMQVRLPFQSHSMTADVSAAIDGSTVIVGTPDLFGSQPRGLAYIFRASGADESSWTQEAVLFTTTTSSRGFFGSSVAIDGNTAVVGAGIAYVYVRSNGVWTLQAALTPPSGISGTAVAIDGDTLLISANGGPYLYRRSGGTWTPQGQLTPSDGTSLFGRSFRIKGDEIIVGANQSAFVFVRSGNTWIEQAKLVADDLSSTDSFGAAVAIDHGTAVVGAPQQTVNGVSNAGAAYVFVREITAWAQESKFTSPTKMDADFDFFRNFGFRVAIDGSTALVGYGDGRPGRAALFNRRADGWLPTTITAADFATEGFGRAVDIEGDKAVVVALTDGTVQPVGVCTASVFRTSTDSNHDGLPDVCAAPLPDHVRVVRDGVVDFDGRSWAHPFGSLNDALAFATYNGFTEIWVAEGTYRRHGEFNLSAVPALPFRLINGVSLYGGFASGGSFAERDPAQHRTILTAAPIPGTLRSYNVLEGYNLTDSEHTLVDGFTIRDANGIRSDDGHLCGGGLYLWNSSPTFRDCIFEANTAKEGGGAVCNVGGGSPEFIDCVFSSNGTPADGGAIFNSDGGSVVVTNSVFEVNSAGLAGGAIHVSGNSSLLVRDSLFVDNTAASGGAYAGLDNAQSTILNSTFSRNSASLGGAMMQGGGALVVEQTIAWANTPYQLHVNGADASVTYSDIDGGLAAVQLSSGSLTWGAGNINADPLFVSPTGPNGVAGDDDDDFHLATGSPCIDAGDPGYVPSLDESDLDGDLRVQGGRIDIGADETPGTLTPGDLDGDSDCDLRDIARFLQCASTHPLPPGCISADMDDSQLVNADDWLGYEILVTGPQ
jgi:hypothetical protein